jgi:HSP20 family protein
MALVRSDPFRDVDRLFQQLAGNAQNGARQMQMPLDAFRNGDTFLVTLDRPGVSAESVDLTVEDNVLTIKAERLAPPKSDQVEVLIAERPYGTYTRQIFLGTHLDTEHIDAQYEAGVLTLSIPIAPHAKPRRIQVSSRTDKELVSA